MRVVATSDRPEGRMSIQKEWVHHPLPAEGESISPHRLGLLNRNGSIRVERFYPDKNGGEFHIILPLADIEYLSRLDTGNPWVRYTEPSSAAEAA